ncbi:hypothetical protein JHK82_049832 [Glycine max]|nr:hypothetical protein JHK86_049705 [Glycine max]KAG4935536.1 hypothetical protein JHK85_050455 [Glycine max]KAG5091054.1 hypothetical protein JHK82_049832 [Glycine max]KAG5094154.1 hypothetical protein JHK84_049742 [Glycine max]
MFNQSSSNATVTASWSDIGLKPGTMNSTQQSASGEISAQLDSHACKMLWILSKLRSCGFKVVVPKTSLVGVVVVIADLYIVLWGKAKEFAENKPEVAPQSSNLQDDHDISSRIDLE